MITVRRPGQFRRWDALILIIVLVSFGLRIWGNQFGLPYTYHMDEWQYVEDAARFAGTGDLKPASWGNPTLLKYSFAVVFGLAYQFRSRFGLVPPESPIISDFLNNQMIYYTLARTFVAALGAATVAIVYQIGRLLYNRSTGLIAAILLALAFQHARDSHFAVSDVPVTFFTAGTVLFLANYIRTRSTRYFYLGMIFVGLAAATKYTAGLMIVIGLAVWGYAHFNNHWKGLTAAYISKEFMIAISLTGLAFLIIVPYAALDPLAFLRTVHGLMNMGKVGFTYAIDRDGSWIFYLKTLTWGLGPPLFVLSMLGLIRGVIRQRAGDFLLVASSLLFYLFYGLSIVFFSRFIIPTIPILIVLAAALVDEVYIWVSSYHPVLGKIAVTALILAAIVPPAVSILRYDNLLGEEDTRTIAKNWIEANIPAQSRILLEWHTPSLNSTINGADPRRFEPRQSYVSLSNETDKPRYLAEWTD
ncbi:glycosyltransferase family 39 protein, partial [bacterium]|nr:glycosyltransferase family 39 protein [bacterium]